MLIDQALIHRGQNADVVVAEPKVVANAAQTAAGATASADKTANQTENSDPSEV